MPLPFKQVFSSMTNRKCFYKKNSFSHVASSIGRFFHLMWYLIISRFRSCLIHVSRIFFGSSMIFPCSLIFGKIVWTGILSLITFFKRKHGRLDVHVKMEVAPICKPYF
jgi:hypothetical protein